MKKTKIIIPALAALCLSAAATVTGTVAWFSASRNTETSVKNIAVINPEGSLSASAQAINNTKVDNGVVKLEDDYALRDASVQVASGDKCNAPIVWKATNVADDGTASTFATVESPYLYNESQGIAYMASWKMTFTIAGSSTDAYHIKFDVTNSSIEDIPTGEDPIYAAFRIALVTKNALAVWAPKDSGTTLSYVKSATGTANYTKCSTDTDLGTIYATSSGETTTSLDVYAYMWFEGTSSACTKDKLATDHTVSASTVLKFFASLS